MLLRFKINSLDPLDMELETIQTEEANSAIMVEGFYPIPLVSTSLNDTFFMTLHDKVISITLDDSQPEHLWGSNAEE